MNLKETCPLGIFEVPEQRIPQFLRSLLIRTYFVINVRHFLGWRGLKPSFKDGECWTCKIKGLKGIFGIYFDSAQKLNSWVRGDFKLIYFPDPEEELVDLLSLDAGIITQQQEYMSKVREFLSFPELKYPFEIATIQIAVNKSEDAILLDLQTTSRQQIISKDGITISQNGEDKCIISPGGYDKNFPAYRIALSFFKVIGATVTFNLSTAPNYFCRENRKGKIFLYDAAENWSEEAKDKIYDINLYLGYGDADFEGIIKQLGKAKPMPIKTFTWKPGHQNHPYYKNALWWNAHQMKDYKILDKSIIGIDERPQFIILTGFLGSGKTSFLQNFIEYQVARNCFVAIIQNEIGKVGLDGKLLDHDYSVVELDEGCVCCTLSGQLSKGIKQILRNFHPDVIILETTGLANPFNLLSEISELEELIRFDSVTTIVDATNIGESIEKYDVARNQIEAADVLVVNKIDLLNAEEIKKVPNILREYNLHAPIVQTKNGDVNPSLLYDMDAVSESKNQSIDIDKKGNNVHHHNHLVDELSSVKISLNTPLDYNAFLKKINAIPKSVFRIKGVVEFTNSVKPVLFQFVNGRYEMSEFKNAKLDERFLIFIGQYLNEEKIKLLFDI